MISPADYEQLVRDEYEWLRQRLGVTAVPLEFTHTPDSGFPKYGGTPRRIVITFSDHDLSVVFNTTVTPDGGPPAWEERTIEGKRFWDPWRSDLWHEVVHQVQDMNGFGWDPNDGSNGHAKGWQAAVEWTANRLGCSEPKALYDLLISPDTPPFAMTNQAKDPKEHVIFTVGYLQNHSAAVKKVLIEYDKVKGQGVGLCHDLAVAIMSELTQRHATEGWTWCRAEVDDGAGGAVEHSWVEYAGWRIDMNERGILRFTKPGDPGNFTVVGTVTRRDAGETKAWADEQERKVRGIPGSGKKAKASR